jgi:hypothetical protein
MVFKDMQNIFAQKRGTQMGLLKAPHRRCSGLKSARVWFETVGKCMGFASFFF